MLSSANIKLAIPTSAKEDGLEERSHRDLEPWISSELDIRNIKTLLNMDLMRCKSPPMVNTEF